MDQEAARWMYAPATGFIFSMGLYALVLALIYLQNRFFKNWLKRNKNSMLFLVNVELLVFLASYQFIFAGFRVFDTQPFQVVPLLFFIGLYFFGLFVFEKSSSSRNSFSDLRLIAPFAIPFALLVFLVDLLQFIPSPALQDFLLHGAESTNGNMAIIGFTVLFMGLLMVFLPYLIQKLWNCKPLENLELENRLQALCERAHFKHAGFKTWTILNHSLTAAIIGVVPRFRYILFTKRLLNEMPPESVEAVLAHEIGHSYHRHLLIYPFIIFGMSIVLGLLSIGFYPLLSQFINWGYEEYPSQIWSMAYPILLFIFYAVVVALYFRFVFGLFSRLFERQADLHVFRLGVPPQHMIQALDYIGHVTASHHTPNWHHWGIQQRIDYLQKAIVNPALVAKHDVRVRKYLIGYFIILAVTSLVLFFL